MSIQETGSGSCLNFLNLSMETSGIIFTVFYLASSHNLCPDSRWENQTTPINGRSVKEFWFIFNLLQSMKSLTPTKRTPRLKVNM